MLQTTPKKDINFSQFDIEAASKKSVAMFLSLHEKQEKIKQTMAVAHKHSRLTGGAVS